MPSGLPLHLRLESYKRLGDRIRQSRIDAGISQTRLAVTAGISHNTMSKIEMGRCRYELLVVLELAQVLNQDVYTWLKD